jgi:hypothetical protein
MTPCMLNVKHVAHLLLAVSDTLLCQFFHCCTAELLFKW